MDPTQIRRPRVLMCYICGREYGLTSLEIHQKQCKALWIKREKGKPKSERRPLPKKPVVDERSFDTAATDSIEQFNVAVQEHFETNMMEECPNCSRTFLEGRLEIHLRSCRPGFTSKPVHQKSKKSFDGEETGVAPKKRSEAPTSFRKNTLGVPGSLKKKPSPRSSPLPNNRSKRTPGKEKVPKNRVPNRTAKVTGHLKEKIRPKVEPEDSQNSGSDSDSVWADMISAVDDAEESGSLTDNEATKIVQFILGRDEAIKDVFLASRGNSNSTRRFIKNAKRRLNVA
eukprot:407059_1